MITLLRRWLGLPARVEALERLLLRPRVASPPTEPPRINITSHDAAETARAVTRELARRSWLRLVRPTGNIEPPRGDN